MRTLHIPLGERSYEIRIEQGLTGSQVERICEHIEPSAVTALISDENVWRLHGESFGSALKSAGVSFTEIVLPAGENTKRFPYLERVYKSLADMRMGRDGTIIAFGGGVIGDLAGFAAATWTRGVRYIQVPTSLLAQVDSSVGGKTAVDIEGGKNMVGAFYQPAFVAIDPDVESTLPIREIRAGMAEIIKCGAIASEKLFDKLRDFRLDKVHEDEFEDILYSGCKIKRNVVAADEHDKGVRLILNFGHTFGHALEAKYGFEKYNHGEAVAIGMRMASRMGESMGITQKGTAKAIDELLARYSLDIREDASSLLPFIKSDKKSEKGGVKLVLLTQIGQTEIFFISYEELESRLAELDSTWQ
ncbi:MAG: 3-dehydroquinate synthase [Clostridiales Family XIII bacterium]|jgi:3-dehydroquinate synthase|nr:3-dehydroquinate synthase [Clostridiales Family XIII bacterium]